MDDELFNEDESYYELYTRLLDYKFDHSPYRDALITVDINYERAMAGEIKRFYPELIDWPNECLSEAWRRYSRDVCLIDEEYVCVRSPDFLSYLFIVQENWQVDGGRWIEAVQSAAKLLWPESIEELNNRLPN
jgi:hypothetical protein